MLNFLIKQIKKQLLKVKIKNHYQLYYIDLKYINLIFLTKKRDSIYFFKF